MTRLLLLLVLVLASVASATNKMRCDQQPSFVCADNSDPNGNPRRDVFVCKAFGAVCDNDVTGHTDGAAIQACLDAAGIGGTVLLPYGYCRIETGALPLKFYAGQVIMGTGLCDLTIGTSCGTVVQPTSLAGGLTLWQSANRAAGCTHGNSGSPKCADGVRFQNFLAEGGGAGDIIFDLGNVNEAVFDHMNIFGRRISPALNQVGINIEALANGAAPTGGLDNRVLNSKIFNITTGIRIRYGNANVIGPGNHLISNDVGITIEGRCTGGTCCTGSNCSGGGTIVACLADADCSNTACGGTGGTCSNATNSGSFENEIGNANIMELNVTAEIVDVGSTTRIHHNHLENGSGSGTGIDERGRGATIVNNDFVNNVSAKSINFTPITGAPVAATAEVEANTFTGGGPYVTETQCSTSIAVYRNLYLGGGAPVTTCGSNSTGVRWIDTVQGSSVASLPAFLATGSVLYATDGTNSDPCSTSGEGPQGQLAFRVGQSSPRWSCGGYLRGLGNGANPRVAFWSDPNTLTSNSLFIFDGTGLAVGSSVGAAGAPIRGVGSGAFFDTYNASPAVTGPQILGRHAYGSEGSETHLLAGKVLATFGGRAWPQGLCVGGGNAGLPCDRHSPDCPGGVCSNNQTFEAGSPATIDLITTDAPTMTAQGADLHFATTLTGTTTKCDKVVVRDNAGIRLFEPQVGSTCGVEYTELAPQQQTANLHYDLPATIATPGQVLTATAVSAPNVTLGFTTPSAATSFATPAANSVNVSAPTPGVATTAIRSDATLQLDQSITPTWTGAHTFSALGKFSAGVDLVQSGLIMELPNDAAGTVLNSPAVLTSTGTVRVSTTTDIIGIVGICVGNCTTSGTAQIARGGIVSCNFDGSTTAGHWVVNSQITANKCRDNGLATFPNSGGQVLGRTITTNAGAGLYQMIVFGNEPEYAIDPTPASGANVRVVGAGRTLTGGVNQITVDGSSGVAKNFATDKTIAFDYSNTLSTGTLATGTCVFSNDTSGVNKGGIICEGTQGDGFQTYIGIASPTADRRQTHPDADGTVPISSSQTDTAFVKYSGTAGQVVPSACTESGGVLSGCTVNANLHGTEFFHTGVFALTSGEDWYVGGRVTSAAAAGQIGTLNSSGILTPFATARTVVVDSMEFVVTVAATGTQTCRMAIYTSTSDANLDPQTRLYQSPDLDTSSAGGCPSVSPPCLRQDGAVTGGASINLTLNPGLYWLALVCQGSTVAQMRGFPNTAAWPILGEDPGFTGTAPYNWYQVTAIGTTPPATIAANAGTRKSTSQVPLLAVRFSS